MRINVFLINRKFHFLLIKKKLLNSLSKSFLLTTQIGLEPTTFAVTGRRSNQLSHWARYFINNGPSGTRTQDRPVMSRLL